ncbi:ester cyclase [Ahrensia kielensis]|uniref:Ester cyclase n=1 Tax=Ahrensia kielensis TaxID=76980 RepID=A0ABU9TAV8_9HYPH
MTPEEALAHYEKSQASLAVVKAMEVGLGNGENDMHRYFAADFRWLGNQGCGTKNGVEEFRRNWQLPLRSAFTEREYKTDQFLADGEWVSCFGHILCTHSGTFMGIEATGKRIKLPYIDFWLVRDGKIADNWVSVDFAMVLAQLGRDVFDGHGWENFDSGSITPPTPTQES